MDTSFANENFPRRGISIVWNDREVTSESLPLEEKISVHDVLDRRVVQDREIRDTENFSRILGR